MMVYNDSEQPLDIPKFNKPFGWYVATGYNPFNVSANGYPYADYLHDDLNIYASTRGTNSSGYFPTEEAAQKALKEGFKVRVCPEYMYGYTNGSLPPPQK